PPAGRRPEPARPAVPLPARLRRALDTLRRGSARESGGLPATKTCGRCEVRKEDPPHPATKKATPKDRPLVRKRGTRPKSYSRLAASFFSSATTFGSI